MLIQILAIIGLPTAFSGSIMLEPFTLMDCKSFEGSQ